MTMQIILEKVLKKHPDLTVHGLEPKGGSELPSVFKARSELARAEFDVSEFEAAYEICARLRPTRTAFVTSGQAAHEASRIAGRRISIGHLIAAALANGLEVRRPGWASEVIFVDIADLRSLADRPASVA